MMEVSGSVSRSINMNGNTPYVSDPVNPQDVATNKCFGSRRSAGCSY